MEEMNTLIRHEMCSVECNLCILPSSPFTPAQKFSTSIKSVVMIHPGDDDDSGKRKL